MPFSSALLVSVATVSADVWQRVACLPEHIPGDQLLDLVLCFPARQIGRAAMHVWDFLCFSPTPYYANTYSSSSSDDDDDDGDEYRYSYTGLEYYDDESESSSSD